MEGGSQIGRTLRPWVRITSHPLPLLSHISSHQDLPQEGGVFLNLGGAFAFNISSSGIWHLSAEIAIRGTEKGRACRDHGASQA